MKDLTARQREIYDWMLAFFLDDNNQRMPTYDEIGNRFDITSKAAIYSLMRTLEGKGYIRIVHSGPGQAGRYSPIKFARIRLFAKAC